MDIETGRVGTMDRRSFLQSVPATLAVGSIPQSAEGTIPESPQRQIWTPENNPFPGCEILVYKDNWEVPCVVELDSESRTYTRLGLFLRDCVTPNGDYLASLEYWKDGKRVLNEELATLNSKVEYTIDGIPSAEWGNINRKTETYDAVILRGDSQVLVDYRSRGLIPSHWGVQTTYCPLPEASVWQEKSRIDNLYGWEIEVFEFRSPWLHEDDSWDLEYVEPVLPSGSGVSLGDMPPRSWKNTASAQVHHLGNTWIGDHRIMIEIIDPKGTVRRTTHDRNFRYRVIRRHTKSHTLG